MIDIPRANRKQRPVFLTPNPLAGNTYRRIHEGDRRCSDEEVKRMLAEQVEDSRDDRILMGCSLDDLDQITFRAYRQMFANREPGHPWNSADDLQFLRNIGGWRKNRETGESGLTLAGLLMFGNMVSTQEELPHYLLDYQERPEAKIERRWVDRLTLDGKWSGNLYDFYRKVYLKLTADLKVPFALEKGERRDDTPVHEALREALANVLVHADYSDRASALVVKRPDMFGFRNPGLMRIPPDIAIQGGEHDCRNRTLHKMFRFVGVGEQAGSGVPKIYHGWQSQHWRPPALYEKNEPYDQTLLELRMIDLFPETVITRLRRQFGGDFDALTHSERVALAIALSEGMVNHPRLRQITDEHPFDLSQMLQSLKQRGMLESTGGRGAIYHLPGANLPTPEGVFGGELLNSGSSSSNLDSSSPNLTKNRDINGCLLTEHLPFPVIDDVNQLEAKFLRSLVDVAREPIVKKKIPQQQMRDILLALCRNRFISLRSLAELVQRKPDTLREQYLTPMVREGLLVLAFPKTPTHERQAYRTANGIVTDNSQHQ